MRPHVLSRRYPVTLNSAPLRILVLKLAGLFKLAGYILNWIKPRAGRDTAKNMSDDSDITHHTMLPVRVGLHYFTFKGVQ